jgi:hypothetical protein
VADVMLFRDLTPGWFDTHSPYRDPPEPPEFWQEELRRVTTIEGDEMVVVRNQDGDEYLVDAFDFDHPGEL